MLPIELKKLVDTFKDNYDWYINPSYNETQLRREFLDKAIKVLGWDVDNNAGYAETFKEVIHEDRQEVEGKTKAPDYCIQSNGGKLFFIEAKKPSVDIKSDSSPAFQVRRYGWSAKLPLSILTDFDEWAIYDTTIKPNANDRASIARIFYCKYDELDKPYKDGLTHWQYIESLFSKQSVMKGSLEKFKKTDKKRGTQEVDTEFLKEIETWREELAKNLVRNNTLTERELNDVVQKTIDRIIFLRICEDRNIENENTLLNLTSKGKVDIYSNLLILFQQADAKYNSGLFHFRQEKGIAEPADELSLRIKISDNVLKDIIKSLYYPAPYQFNQMPADILGSVYERFLGKVIRLTSNHRAIVEEKPEVRKAGGVYYTPSYIVDYIVENTIGEQLKGKNPKTIGKFRVVDPACGSGSFLIVAYQKMLDWYLQEYMKSPASYKKQLIKTGADSYKLTIAERKRILIDHIFGVDIDTQAVEVSKLSLLLKTLEGITAQEASPKLAIERILPNLGSNIKCGNSLIGSDFYSGQQQLALSIDEQLKINVFDWDKEFKNIFADGGFDAVIGNPPYVKEYTDRSAFENIRKAKLAKYYQGKMDLWYFFICYGLDILKPKGKLGFIAPNNWITNSGASILRNKILSDSKIEKYIDFGDFRVFPEAGIQTMVFVLSKEYHKKYKFDYFKVIDKGLELFDLPSILTNSPAIKHILIGMDSEKMKDKLITFVDKGNEEILNKISKSGSYRLSDKDIAQGIVYPQDFLNQKNQNILGDDFQVGDGIFVITDQEKKSLSLTKEELSLVKPEFNTVQLGRYFADNKNNTWVIYTDSSFKNPESMKPYPNLKRHLDKFTKVITSDNAPYGLHRTRKEDFFKGEKIVSLRKCAGQPKFSYVDFDSYVSATFYVIKPKDINLKYLTGLLNSKLIAFWLKNKGKMQGSNYQIDKEPLLNIPIFKTENIKHQEQMASLVDSMLKLKRQEQTAKTPQEKAVYERQIAGLDNEINNLVYKLYDLTPTEIKIIES